LAPYAEESLRRLGMTVQLCGGNPPLQVAACETAWVPYTTRIMSPHDANGIMQPVCWNDVPAVDDYVQKIADQYTGARAHGVFVYSLGDETVTRGSCVHPACLAAYRQHLEQEYGDVKALNDSWGTIYASFDDVQLSEPKDDMEAAALRAKNYPRWYDRQAFQSYNFVQFCGRFAKAYHRMDPQERTGFEGAGRLEDGDDFDLIVRSNGFWSPYPGAGDEIIRSLAPRDFPRANWMGYTHDADSLLSVYWRMVTRGTDAVWFWRWDNIGQFHGLLMPHLGPFPAVKEITKDTQVLRDGLGNLLLKSEMQDDGIALLYSMPSAYTNRIEAGPSYGACGDAHVAWHKAIRELGLQFRYVTDRQLRLGEFDPKRFKVLILPQTEAIGPKEAQVIRDFVNGGGHLIADVRPGLYDGHCKPLAEGALDDLFGVKRAANAPAVTTTAELKFAENRPPLALASVRTDPEVALAGGTALGHAGETPIFIRHTVGRGRATLLNVTLPSLPSLGRAETPEDLAVALRSLFDAAGVRPAIKLLDSEGARLRNCELVRWRNGPTEIIALFREQGETQKARVVLPRSLTVYDLRNRKPLGQADAFATTILPCRASFFVLAERPAESPALALASPAVARGQVAKLRVASRDRLGLHAFRLSALLPDGSPAAWVSQVVVAGDQGAEVVLPVAFNDAAGTWQIQVTDVYTNRPTTIKLQVK
jgi:beta-galactosidase